MASSSAIPSARRKLALIIGNNDYSRPESKLRHCINDANDLSEKLESIGFHVYRHINLNNAQMITAIVSFAKTINDGDLVLFYFSGHGYQVRGFNYLMPVDDGDIDTEDDVVDFAVPVERTIDRLARRNPSHVTVCILDCCRKYWPKVVLKKVLQEKGSTKGKGLSVQDAPAGTFIQFACGVNRTACDGAETERNGLFTKHLLQHITNPNEDIVQIFQGVAGDVYTESQGVQKPLSVNGLIKKGHVYVSDHTYAKPITEPIIAEYPLTILSPSSEVTASNGDAGQTRVLVNSCPSQRTERRSIESRTISAVHKTKGLYTSDSLGSSFECCSLDDRYMMLVGRLTSREHVNELTTIVANIQSDDVTLTTTEKLEHLLEYVTLSSSTASHARGDRPMLADHFNATLRNLLGRDTSFETLRNACRRHETSSRANVDQPMRLPEDRAPTSTSYFTDKGLEADNARAAAFALAFYTKTKSNVVNQTARRLARYSNGEQLDKTSEEQMNESVTIVYHLFNALSVIPYYWGQVTCAYQLTDEELELYQPGALITWIQFVRGRKDADRSRSSKVSSRNTQFRICSLTGRRIKQFSHYPDEDEVIFLPHSTYCVYKRELSSDGKQHTISMRQLELGLSKYSILWVDDRIFHQQNEIKAYMENAAHDGLSSDVHFIPRSSSNGALAFLRSPFGQRLKNQNTFRIITCMTRKSEASAHNAGVRLIKAVRELGFDNHCLVFTSNQERSEATVRSELTATEQKSLTVATQVSALKHFISFQS